jgi:hypothetical protein
MSAASKLNLSSATKDELVDLIRRQAQKLKELQNTALLLQEKDTRIMSLEQSMELCKQELREERASHVADNAAMQEQLQQLSQAVVDAHEKMANLQTSAVAAASSERSTAEAAVGKGGGVDVAYATLLASRSSRLQTEVDALRAELLATASDRDALLRRVSLLERDTFANGKQRVSQLEGQLAQALGELEERSLELQSERAISVDRQETIESLSQQLATLEAAYETSSASLAAVGGGAGAGIASSAARSRVTRHRGSNGDLELHHPIPRSSTRDDVVGPEGSGHRRRSPTLTSSSTSTSSPVGTSSTSSSDDEIPRDRIRRGVEGQQRARVIGLDGDAQHGAVGSAGATMFGGGAAISRMKRQIADLLVEQRRRDDAAAARAREEAATRAELVETVNTLRLKLEALSSPPTSAFETLHVETQTSTSDDIYDDERGERYLELVGATPDRLKHCQETVQFLWNFYQAFRGDV